MRSFNVLTGGSRRTHNDTSTELAKAEAMIIKALLNNDSLRDTNISHDAEGV